MLLLKKNTTKSSLVFELSLKKMEGSHARHAMRKKKKKDEKFGIFLPLRLRVVKDYSLK